MKDKEISKGKFLYADPMLHDPYFKRSVIMLVEHNNQGTVGFIINKQLEIELNEVLKLNLPSDIKLNYGGPVNTNNLYYIHQLGNLIDESIEIREGCYWGGNFETIKSLLFTQTIKTKDIKFFIGYTGWSEGQLEQELKEDSWLISDGNPNGIFIENEIKEIWKKKMTSLGSKYALWANFPENPSLN